MFLVCSISQGGKVDKNTGKEMYPNGEGCMYSLCNHISCELAKENAQNLLGWHMNCRLAMQVTADFLHRIFL